MLLLNGSFQAFEKNKYPSITATLLNICLLSFILITILNDYGIYGVAISYILANFIGMCYAYISMRKHITVPKFDIDRQFCKKILMLSFPFTLTILFYQIYYSIDMIMITRLVGDYANGIYGASYKLILVLTVFQRSL